MIRKDIHQDPSFVELFNTETGAYLRTGILDKDGHDTNEDPFMRKMPSLIDVGIMGRCKNAHLCTIGCYQGKRSDGKNMTLEDYKSIIDQVKDHVYQIALGGAGSPDEHENFEEILQYTVQNGIVPNYTTSGIGVTEDIARLTKAHCGAVAVSLYSRKEQVKMRKKIK